MPISSVIFLLFTLTALHARAQGDAQAPIAPELTSEFADAPESAQTEIYSENSFRPEYDSFTTDTRLRYQKPVLLKNLRAYVGATIERDLQSEAKLKFISNAVSPQVGLLYQPLTYLNLWAEYRHRYQESMKDTKPSGESDPRVGVSTGYYAGHEALRFEAYGEAVWVPRLSSGGILSGYARPFVRQEVSALLNADLYSELYGYSSPGPEMGPSRTQARVGGRLHLHSGTWQASLLVYKPWNLRTDLGTETQPEALLVLGGLF